MDEVAGDWRKLNIEEFNILYSSPYIAQVIKSGMSWEGHVTHMGEWKALYRVMVRKPGGKGPQGRPRHR